MIEDKTKTKCESESVRRSLPILFMCCCCCCFLLWSCSFSCSPRGARTPTDPFIDPSSRCSPPPTTRTPSLCLSPLSSTPKTYLPTYLCFFPSFVPLSRPPTPPFLAPSSLSHCPFLYRSTAASTYRARPSSQKLPSSSKTRPIENFSVLFWFGLVLERDDETRRLCVYWRGLTHERERPRDAACVPLNRDRGRNTSNKPKPRTGDGGRVLAPRLLQDDGVLVLEARELRPHAQAALGQLFKLVGCVPCLW